MTKTLSIASTVILIFGFLYLTWHLGVKAGKDSVICPDVKQERIYLIKEKNELNKEKRIYREIVKELEKRKRRSITN